MANYNGNSNKFIDTLADPSAVPTFNGIVATDPTSIPEIEQAIIDGFKDEISLRYAKFIRDKMYGVDVRESIARFGLWLDIRTNSVESKGSQIILEYLDMQKELEDFREQFEIITSSSTIDGEVKLARHSLLTGKTYPSLKARLDWMENEHYVKKIGEIESNRTLIDDDFKRTHQVIKTGSVISKKEIYPLVFAEIDSKSQNRFKFRKVGDI